MNILDKIIELLEKQNRQQKDLTDFLGLEKSTFSAWKSKKSSSYKKYLPEIANFFKISIDELTGNQTKRVELSNISQIFLRTRYTKSLFLLRCLRGSVLLLRKMSLSICLLS